MSSSDVLSSPNAAAVTAGPRKSSHLKLVGKTGKHDSDKSDGTQGAKAKLAKGKADAKTDAKIPNKDSTVETVQGQFASLLQQVEGKLNQKQPASDEDDIASDDADSEHTDGSDADSSNVNSQNGTTSLFAAAYMMRGWEPALIAKADTSSTKDASEEAPVAANGNKTTIPSKSADSKLEVAVKSNEAKTQTAAFDAGNQQMAPPAKLQPGEIQAQPVKVEPSDNDVTETVVLQIQASAAVIAEAKVMAEAKVQSPPSPPQDGGVKADMKTIADAQANGVVGPIHVAQAQEQDSETGRGAEDGKDDTHKDQPVAAKIEAAQPAVKAETVAVAAAVSATSTEAPSPVSQVVERILQELPAQNIAATADQVAVANKVLTVRLSPEGLGNVLVKISNAGGTLKISLSSEQKTTSDQLKSDSLQLLQALQQVMPSFSSDSLSFSTQDQGNGNAQNNTGAGQNAMGGNANSGQGNEGQSNAEQGNRQVPGRTYGSSDQGTSEADTAADARRSQRAGSIYL